MPPYLYTRADTGPGWLLVAFPGGHTLRWRPWSIVCVNVPEKDAPIFQAAFGCPPQST